MKQSDQLFVESGKNDLKLDKSQKIIILTSRFPYPAIGGDKQLLINLAQALCSSYRVTLLCLCETRREMEIDVIDSPFYSIHRVYMPKRQSYWNSFKAIFGSKPLQVAYYESSAFRNKLTELLPSHCGVIAHLIRTSQYLELYEETPKILVMADAISLNYQRMKTLTSRHTLKRHIYSFEQPRLNKYESSLPNEFDQIWLHSEIDRDYLHFDGNTNIEIIPMGVNLVDYPFEANRTGDTIIFIGNMVSAQNQDACYYFASRILPLIRKSINLKFRIIGNSSEGVMKKLQTYPGVEATGPVEKIASAVENAFCGVCPVRAGAGVQNKVLNYFALGLPCVTSKIGLEGIEAEHNVHLLVFESPQQAANQILELFHGQQLRSRLALNARLLVEAKYSWESIYSKMVTCAETVFSAKSR